MIQRLHDLQHNLLLSRLRSVLLLERDRESIEKSFVQNVRGSELSAFVALALRVRSSEDSEPGFGLHESTDLLQEDALTFEHGLQAHNLVRCEIDFVEQKHGTALHRGNDRTILPDGIAIDQAETTEQVVFVRCGSNVHAKQLALLLSANLIDHRGLAVTGKPGNEDRIEHSARDDALNVVEISPRNIRRDLRRYERLGFSRRHRQSESCIGFHRRNSRSCDGSRSGHRRRGRRLGVGALTRHRAPVEQIRHIPRSTAGLATRIGPNPCRNAGPSTVLRSCEQIRVRCDRRTSGSDHGFDETRLLGLEIQN